jgi:hypothetical protein
MVIVGGAQFFMAFVLALITAFFWKSTDKYAKLTEKDLEMKAKIRAIERLHKELDNIIGPLYSKLGDPIYFNNSPINWTMWHPDEAKMQGTYRGSEFWRDIKKNLYLTNYEPETRKNIKQYLNIKLGTKKWLSETDPGYVKDLKNITDTVEDRYEKLTKELDQLENMPPNT